MDQDPNVPRVVFRVDKLKAMSNISSAASHNLRKRDTPNADPSRLRNNIILKGPATETGIVDACKDKISRVKNIRKNAVLGYEAVISASPQYFRPDNPDEAGYWNEDKLKAWREAIEPWIAKRFPDAVSVVLHLDEATPHYQIVGVPIDEKGKLNYRGRFGGDRQTLRDWQTEAARPVKHLGIERGIEGSRAKHTTLKEYYAHINKEPAPLPPVTKKPEPLPPPTIAEKIPFTDAARERAEKEAEHARIQKKRAEEMEAKKKAALDNYPILNAKAKGTILAQKKAEITSQNFDMMEKKIQDKDAQIAALKAESDRLRALPIVEVLSRLYGAEMDKESKASHATIKYKLMDGREVAVSPGKNGGEVWVVQGGKGSKGAINLVMQLDGIEYKEALKVLGDAFGTNAVVREHRRELVDKARTEVKTALSEPRTLPAPDETKWPKVKAWLRDVRAIPSKLADWLHSQKRLYSDSRNNAVFLRAEGGAFLRGTTSAKFFRTIGGKDCGPYIVPGDDSQVIICEAPVDALSLKAIHPNAKVIAIGGNLLTPEDIKKHIQDGAKVLLGFDGDAQGLAFEQQAKAAWPDAETLKLPSDTKDWNEGLQRGLVAVDDVWSEQEVSRTGSNTEQNRRHERQKF